MARKKKNKALSNLLIFGGVAFAGFSYWKKNQSDGSDDGGFMTPPITNNPPQTTSGETLEPTKRSLVPMP